MPKNIVAVQTALMPAFYKDFHCLAKDCKDSCCLGWKIEFNKKDYLAIKRGVDGAKDEALKDLCARSMSRLREKEHDGMYAEFLASVEGRCGFLREDGLCALQLGCGEGTLPKVCKTFPRLVRQTMAAKELSLTPACEGVLALLWDLPDGIDFIEEPLEKKDCKRYEAANPVVARFADIRALCIDVIQDRSLRLSRRMLLLGVLLQRLRDADWKAEGTADEWLAWAKPMLGSQAVAAELEGLPGDRRLFMANNHRVMTTSMLGRDNSTAELAKELWASIVTAAPGQEENQYTVTYDLERYQALEDKLEELLGHSDCFFENLMVAVDFYLSFPDLTDPEKLWESYVNLCNLYSLFRFAAVCGCAKEVSRERLFHVLVGISRALLHNSARRNQLRDEFFQHDSATLAHMAILVGG